jgi:autotransporter-associated beta strand protein
MKTGINRIFSPNLCFAASLVLIIMAAQSSLATTFLWNVATSGANSWATAANWLPGSGFPGPLDTAIFGAVGTSAGSASINNVVPNNTTVTALTFTNTTSGTWHVTQIPINTTLTVTNLTVGFGTAVNGLVTSAAMVDAGTLAVYGNLTVGNNGSTTVNTGTILDLSGLTNFIYNASSGTITMGTGTRSGASLKLAQTNVITAGTWNANVASTSSTATGTLTLGAPTNIINVGTFNISAGRGSCTVQFPGSGSALRLRGVGGTDADRCTMTVANHSLSGTISASSITGILNLNGNSVDMKLGTLTLGESIVSGTISGNNIGTGAFSFDTGTVDATTINMAICSGNASFDQANGTLNVGAAGTLIVGSGGMSLVNLSGGNAATGNLNITNGSVICSNSIVKATSAGTGAINLIGGKLNMVGGRVGSSAIPVDALTIGDATLTLVPDPTTTNIVVATLTTISTTNNLVNISALPVITSFPAQYKLIAYSGSLNNFDFLLGTLPSSFTGYISNNTTTATIDLVITNGPILIRPLVWNGAPNGNWDVSTTNWIYSGSPTAYNQGDIVTFDDTAAGTTNVNLTSIFTPTSITVSNNTKPYDFSGTGGISGTNGIVKMGAAALILSNTGPNTFVGNVTINGGLLKLAGVANELPTNSTVTLADDATAAFDLNGLNQQLNSLSGGGGTGGNVSLGAATLTVYGGGGYGGIISGTGRLVKTNFVAGGTLTLSNANTYSGGTIIGGFTNNTSLSVGNQTGSGTGSGFVTVLTNGTLNIGINAAGGSIAASVITNAGTVRLFRNDDFTFTNFITGPGTLFVQSSNNVIINGANNYTGGTTVNLGNLRISNPNALGSGPIIIGNNVPTALQLTNGITLVNALTLQSKPSASGTVPNLENLAGTNTVSGPIQLTQNGSIGWVVTVTAGQLLITGNIIPVLPSQTSQNGSRNLLLNGAANGIWSGNINDSVNSSTNVAVIMGGTGTWTLTGANTYSGTTTVNNGTLVVNGQILGTNAVAVNNGTLSGTGLINGPVTVGNSGGIIEPGTAASYGTLTVSNNLTVIGTALMKVSHSSNDKIVGIGTLHEFGYLQVTVNGSLSGGEVFKLFDATNYDGTFDTSQLPTLPSPLGWDASMLGVNGTLSVTGGSPILGVSQSGNQLTFSWTGAYKLQAQTNSLAIGLSNNWTDYPGGGSSPVSVTITPTTPAVFFRLISQ